MRRANAAYSSFSTTGRVRFDVKRSLTVFWPAAGCPLLGGRVAGAVGGAHAAVLAAELGGLGGQVAIWSSVR